MLFVLPTIAVQSATVELSRGVALGTPGYWAVQDAYLDKAEANQDHGGGFTLLGGDGRTVLIRFGDLQRAIGPNRRVTSATLVLTPSGGDVPKVKSVVQVDSAWGEGPIATLTKIIANIEARPGEPKPKAGAARGAATWNERRAGIAAWPSPGSPGGTPLEAMPTSKERTVEIAGLNGAVQNWLDRPWSNHGLALTFEGNVEFFSSQSPSGRPRLILTSEPVFTTLQTKPDLAVLAIVKTEGRWSARVKNVGSAPASGARLTWWTDGKPATETALEKTLAPGEQTTLPYAGGEPSNDTQVPTLGLALAPAAGDTSTANDRLDVFAGGKPVSLRLADGVDAGEVVNVWNETVAPQSRFSFAPEGAKIKVRLVSSETAADGAKTLLEALRQIGKALGLPDGAPQNPPGPPGSDDLFPGIMGYGDTRFEGSLPGKLLLPYEPYSDSATETALLEPTGLLSASDVGRLNDTTAPLPMPRATLLRVVDLVGRPLPGLDLTIEQVGAATVRLTTSPSGTLLLPSRGPDGPFGGLAPDLSNGIITLSGTQHGITETAFVKAWRLSDAFRRSGSPAVLMDVRLNLPMLALESGTDLARDRIVTDSAGSEPAKLAAITDGNEVTAAPLPEKVGAWVDIDLGRDRTLGEIALRYGDGAFWERYEIRVYATGQKPEDALIWAGELNSDWARKNRANAGWISYRSPVQRIRYVRIISRTGGPASLAEIRVVPIKLQG